MIHGFKKYLCAFLSLLLLASLAPSAMASGITYMPGVTREMSDAAYWAKLSDGAQEVILTPEEIQAFNADTYIASGTMVMDLRTAKESFDGVARNQAVKSSSKADAKYYFGWTYGPDGRKADWSYYEKMIRNCYDPRAKTEMPVRYAVAVERTVLQVFPSENPIWDDPADHDFNYQYLSAVQVNDPMLIYTRSRDGKYYLARSRDCSGWIPAKDIAICKDKAEWLSAWDHPSEKLLVVYGNKEYTDASNTAPETSRRMLAQGTRLELVTDLQPDQLVNNRSPYHNYVVYLPVRARDGSYEKHMALIPETAKVSVGYLSLTEENIAMVMLNNLGDAYGWGGMLDVEDCSGLIRTVYACFGLEIGRNGNWQWNMNMEKIDMAYMSDEEKRLILDELPIGAALCFPGHEMMYLGKVNGEYYVVSTVSSIMSPDTGNRLRTRDVMINTLDVKRANGQTWLQALNMAFMPCYAKLEGKTYDFPETQWYHDGVAYCLKNGIMSNFADGTFGIGTAADRATLAQALWVMAGKPAVEAACPFVDVPDTSPAKTSITWAANNGILGGYTSAAFAPEDAVTRQQLVTALWRFAKLMGTDVSAGENADIRSYKDAFAVREYAVPAFQWACGAGVVNGYADGTLKPEATATRAHVAQMLMNFLNK